MTVQLPGDLKDGEFGGDPEPIEELPPVADVAPILVEQAGIPESKLQDDWKMIKDPPKPVEPMIPAHHLRAVYNRLQSGSSVEEAARIAQVPIEAAQAIAAEIVAVCATLGSVPPENCKPAPAIEPGPIEPIEDPIIDPGPVKEPVG